MSFRKLAAVLLAGGLALTACGQQSNLGSSAPSAPPVASGATFPEGSTMAKLAAAGTIRVGTKFDQPLLRPQGPRRQAGRLRRRDRQDRLRQARHPGRQDRLHRDALEDPRGRHRQRPGRHGRRDLHHQRRPQAEDLLRRAVLHRGPGPDGQVRQHDDHRAGDAQGRQRPGVLGERLDARQEHHAVRRPGQHRALRRLLQVRRRAAQRPGRGRHHRQRDPRPASSSTSQGAFKLVNKPFTKEPYGIGITKGNTAFCQFINDTLKASDADGSYSAAWKATVGTVQPEVPPLPAADACS